MPRLLYHCQKPRLIVCWSMRRAQGRARSGATRKSAGASQPRILRICPYASSVFSLMRRRWCAPEVASSTRPARSSARRTKRLWPPFFVTTVLSSRSRRPSSRRFRAFQERRGRGRTEMARTVSSSVPLSAEVKGGRQWFTLALKENETADERRYTQINQERKRHKRK